VNDVISVLVLTYNRRNIVSMCLPYIAEHLEKSNSEILIWDNGSTDGTLDWIFQFAHSNTKNKINVFFSEKNYGVEAINFLVDKTVGEYIIKVDSDIIPPVQYDTRMLTAYIACAKENIAYLSWDIPWGHTSFAKRSGMKLYKGDRGTIVSVTPNTRVLCNYAPSKWMVNGACRFSEKDVFTKLGSHPQGKRYEVDTYVSAQAEKAGYTCGFIDTHDKAQHITQMDIMEKIYGKTSTT